jgi:16S rRNA (adenine1518-N6/adenine1519-N6)-dimethyltransferase
MRLGQHFLINKAVARKIIAALEIKSNDVILEIGAGHGELTEELNRESQLPNRAVKIIAIEKDAKLVSGLIGLKVNKLLDNVEIVKGDVRNMLPQIIKTYNLQPATYKLVGNIPYYLSGYLLRLIGELNQKPALGVFTVQKEVAERIASRPPRMNKLAAAVRFWAIPAILGIVSKKDFRPIPGVDSAIIKLETRKREIFPLPANYYKTVNILFRQPRKTILNNLQARSNELEITKERIAEKLAEIGIISQDRPQNLSVEDIVKIANSFINELKS